MAHAALSGCPYALTTVAMLCNEMNQTFYCELNSVNYDSCTIMYLVSMVTAASRGPMRRLVISSLVASCGQCRRKLQMEERAPARPSNATCQSENMHILLCD